MAINNHFNLWVTRYEQHKDTDVLLDGIVFDGELGFGNEVKRSYVGNVKILTATCSVEMNVEIMAAHISRKGLMWSLESKEIQKFQPPFMITSNTEMKRLNNAVWAFEPEKGIRAELLSKGDGEYPLVSKECIAILRVKGSKFSIDIYSCAGNIEIENELVFDFSEWDCPAGVAKIQE